MTTCTPIWCEAPVQRRVLRWRAIRDWDDMVVARTTLLPQCQLALAAGVRAALQVQVGDVLESKIHEEGVTVWRMPFIPTEQAWFWTEEWQRGEGAASADIEAGRTTVYKNSDDFLDTLSS